MSIRSYSLRVSVLENCQYRCSYCLPGSVKPFAHKPNWLKRKDYASIANALASFPIRKVRFTGGEPLLRSDLCEIVSAFRASLPGAKLSLTTNAQHLQKAAEGLLDSGITSINVHIDTLVGSKYKNVMGNGDLDSILPSLFEIKPRLEELKINVVLQNGVNDDELVSFIAFSKEHKIEVRFIELMNTGSARDYVSKHFLSGKSALAILSRHYQLREIPRRHRSDPAALFEIPDLGIRFGLIASDTQPFCSACDRLRLTAEGTLKGCLYAPSGVPLAALVKAGASSEQMTKAIEQAIAGKKSFHPLVAGSEHNFSMAEIGG